MANRQDKIKKFIEGMISMQRAIGSSRDSFFSKFGLNKAQIGILYHISQNYEITDISKHLGVTKGAITQIVNTLVKEGFVRRVKSTEDKRTVKIEFTTDGFKKFQEFKKAHMKRISECLRNLTDEEIETLIRIQKKIQFTN